MENTLQHIFSTDYDQDTFFSGVLEYVFGAENITKQEYPEEFISSDADRNLAQAANILSIKKVGGIEGFFNEFSIFDITLGDDSKIAYSRVNIQNVLRKKLYGENAFLLFHYQNPEGKEWRLSYLYSYGKASTDSKRYTYLLGSQHNARTVTERFTKLKNDLVFLKDDDTKSKDLLEEAFSVEALTKEFYNRLFEWYQWAVLPETKVSFPNLVNTQSDDRDDIDTKIIRLITRLMFVWFIKQKQLVPDRIFDTTYLKTILKDFDPQSRTNGYYYNAILQNLFFATLNRAIKDEDGKTRGFAHLQNNRDVKTLYRYAEMFSIGEDEVVDMFAQVPFLNGGLFECLDKSQAMDGVDRNDDGFSRNATCFADGTPKYRAVVPNVLFFDPVRGLLPLLSQYNFTVEENTPLEQTVALDPELLGKVFENLLGTYNEETKETARNESGSFYTPREIVNYMVDESIRNYLLKEGIDGQVVDNIFNDNFTVGQMQQVATALKKIKILDPACGSGAFPMGILNRIVELISKINPQEDAYQLKLHIIENCIYGSDIQQIAVQICKLRFFISLVCDCKKDETKPNFGIPTLPNLETKFVCADSLIAPKIADKKDLNFDFNSIQDILDQLLEVRKKHFSAKTRKDKITLREKDENLRNKLKERLSNTNNVDSPQVVQIKTVIEYYENTIKRMEDQNQAMADNYCAELLERKKLLNTDVSLPPLENYLQNKTYLANKAKIAQHKQELEKQKAKLESEQKKTQKFTGNSTTDEAAKEVSDWNPYDQNQQCKWFSPKYMFDIDGFDIIIGNPPYIQLQNNGGKLANEYKDCGYESFAKTGDIYCLFYERAHQLLKEGGLCCYITSNKWMRAGYGEALRTFFANKTNPLLLIDFAGVKVFDSATVDTNILIFSKHAPQNQTLACSAKTLSKQDLKNLAAFVKDNTVQCNFPAGDSWVILSPIEQSIKRKIESVGTPLKDWDIQINYGIKTGFNDAFIITTEKKDEILAACATAEERQKTAEIIRPILRGRDIKRYGYDWADLWLIATFPSKKYDIEQLPAIKNHLLSFGKERLEQTGKKYNGFSARKKTNNKWFETQDSISYWDDFNKPKIMWKIIGCNINFCFDEKQMICNNAVNIMVGNKDNLIQFCGLMNSKLFDWYLKATTEAEVQGGGIQLYVTTLEDTLLKLNFPSSFTDKVRQRIVNQSSDNELNNYIYELYNLNPDEIAFIENNVR